MSRIHAREVSNLITYRESRYVYCFLVIQLTAWKDSEKTSAIVRESVELHAKG